MNSLLSVDVGSKNIHILEGAFSKGTITVENMNSVEIPNGTFSAETIINEELLTDCLNDAIKKINSNKKEIIISINASSAVVRDIDLPSAKPKELDQMIKNELYQTYHVLPTDVIQYKLIEKIVGENGQTLNKYRAATIDEDIVDTYRQIALKLKLKPIALDINVNSIDKLFSSEMMINDKILDGAATMAIDMGAKSTTIYIFSRGKSAFYRHLSIGSDQIENLIHDETLASVSDILKMKEEGFNFFEENESTESYYKFLKQYFYNLNDEIRKIMGFYTSRANNMNIEQVYLFGGGSSLAGIADYWSSNFNIPVEQIVDISRIKTINKASSIHNYLNAIGALIRY